MTARPQVVVVGAGPAGIRAAEALASAGLVPLVIDEGERAGGQIYRRPPDALSRPPAVLYGSEAGKAVALHATFDRLVAQGRARHWPRCAVLAVAERSLQVLGPEGVSTVRFDRLVLATGATDRLAPVQGWDSPGVYSLGAMQVALKAQAVALGRRIVLAGSGPLLTLVATQLLAAGARLEAVLDTASLADQLRGLPDLMTRPSLTVRGLAMRARLARLYRPGVRLGAIETDARGPVAVTWHDAWGRPRRSPCDAVGLGWHLRAETQLAELAGCAFDFDETWRQWLPRGDAMGRGAEGVYLAGDGFRLRGADGAELSGRLAGAACLEDLGLPVQRTAADLAALSRVSRFAQGIARAFPWPRDMVRQTPDGTVVCRCEGVTAGMVRAAAAHGGADVNRAKSLGRVGMGRCQGRYCQIAGAEIVAAAAGHASPAQAGRLRGQAPVRPAPVAAIAGPAAAVDPLQGDR